MAHEGQQLEKYLATKNLSAYNLADELGITAQNVYYHLKRPQISLVFKERLARAGHNVFNLPVRPDKPAIASEADVKQFGTELDALKTEIEYLKQILAAKDEVIKVKDEIIAAFKAGLKR